VKLYSETFGDEGNPGIIFCHGFGGSARNFRLQARLLEARFRITLFDLRGHARSPAPEDPESYRIEALLSDLDELVQAQPTPLILAGLSLGAKLSLDYALLHPERVCWPRTRPRVTSKRGGLGHSVLRTRSSSGA
jgi:pimeloyl-ACP methyl ester carboxylesterase